MQILGFDYPDECFYLLERDMWCRPLADGRLQVGVTSFGIHLSGDFFMCRPKPVGTTTGQGETLAVAELSKSVVAIKTPVSGAISEINPLLEDTPEIIHQDPYGQGWLVTITPNRWEQDLPQLAHGPQLEAAATARMRLENIKFPPA
ncbi:glycine cleavage system protein H [Polaromonas sp. YR568]|uniref:glycine cleavage system protein H n=1 Tax=Polaromonas sp. YR568 TaxID=1855301 RepID=UPI00398C1EBB